MDKSYISNLINDLNNTNSNKNTIFSITNKRFVSTTQLYRDFYNYTGYTIKDYVLKRQISKACMLVKQSDIKLIDIAFACGYDSQQAFNKAFKKVVGMSPLQYKNCEKYFYFQQHTDLPAYQIDVSQQKFGPVIQCKYYGHSIKKIEANALKSLLSLPLDLNSIRVFGRNGKQNGALFCYELTLQTHEPAIFDILANSPFASAAAGALREGLYAVTHVQNDRETIEHAWNYLYNNWLPISNFEKANTDYFEEYIVKNNRIKSLRLYLPVCKSDRQNMITIQTQPNRYFLTSVKRGVNPEQRASLSVLNFLKSTSPVSIGKKDYFYLSQDENQCECGVELWNDLHMSLNDLRIIQKSGGLYACVKSNHLNGYHVLKNMLLDWANENSIDTEGDVFAVCRDKTVFSDEEMTVYSKIKKW
jgi:AraC-like DNA-binding protein